MVQGYTAREDFLIRRFQAKKGVLRLGLEAFLLALEYPLLNSWLRNNMRRKFSHSQSRLQAQKGVNRVGLEALLPTLEHPLITKFDTGTSSI